MLLVNDTIPESRTSGIKLTCVLIFHLQNQKSCVDFISLLVFPTKDSEILYGRGCVLLISMALTLHCAWNTNVYQMANGRLAQISKTIWSLK